MTNEPKLIWEDFTVGRIWNHGFHTVSEAEIMSFAALYDPLPMHLDPILARESPLGVFCASGIHTLAIAQRALCDAVLKNTHVIAGGGIDRVRMCAPVVPGDVLRVRVLVGRTWQHPKKPCCGWIMLQIEVLRHDNYIVMNYELTLLVRRTRST